MVATLQPRCFRRVNERAAKRYSSDLTDREWEMLRSFLPPQRLGRGRKPEMSEAMIQGAMIRLMLQRLVQQLDEQQEES